MQVKKLKFPSIIDHRLIGVITARTGNRVETAGMSPNVILEWFPPICPTYYPEVEQSSLQLFSSALVAA